MAARPQQPESELSARAASQGASPGATAKAAALTSTKTSPVMRQYLEIKSGHEDAILFFRLGDFFEMFFDDAIVASRDLDITLTSRNKEKGEKIPCAVCPCGAPTAT